MPRTNITEQFDLATRNEFTKVDCVVSITLEGKELPSLSVQGVAMEAILDTLKGVVKESYKQIPERV